MPLPHVAIAAPETAHAAKWAEPIFQLEQIGLGVWCPGEDAEEDRYNAARTVLIYVGDLKISPVFLVAATLLCAERGADVGLVLQEYAGSAGKTQQSEARAALVETLEDKGGRVFSSPYLAASWAAMRARG